MQKSFPPVWNSRLISAKQNGQPMHSQLALTEHVSLNLASLILLDPVKAGTILDRQTEYDKFHFQMSLAWKSSIGEEPQTHEHCSSNVCELWIGGEWTVIVQPLNISCYRRWWSTSVFSIVRKRWDLFMPKGPKSWFGFTSGSQHTVEEKPNHGNQTSRSVHIDVKRLNVWSSEGVT